MSHRNASLVVLTAAVLATPCFAGGSITLNPANNIQAAINSGLYTEIVLEPGTYNQLVDFNGAAITLRSTNPSDPATVAATILDGTNLFDSIVQIDDGEGPDTQILGLTFTNGVATPDGSASDRGGAIEIFTASPTIEDCVFVGNTAVFGGAIYTNMASVTMRRCTFEDNVATSAGGGLYINAGSSFVDLEDCVFVGNTAEQFDGGGLRTQDVAIALLRCTFEDNVAGRYGGGAFLVSSNSTLDRCAFVGNEANDGGAVRMVSGGGTLLTDCILRENVAAGSGGALMVHQPSTIRGCTFVGNTAVIGADVEANANAFGTTIRSSILWSAGSGAPIEGSLAPSVQYSIVRGGFAGPGVLDVDPQFVDLAGGDLRLTAGSPAIDAGDTAAYTEAFPQDFDGAPRAANDPAAPDTGIALLGLAVDMGAFEFPVEDGGGDPSCPSDVDADDTVGFSDLLAVLAAWGTCP